MNTAAYYLNPASPDVRCDNWPECMRDFEQEIEIPATMPMLGRGKRLLCPECAQGLREDIELELAAPPACTECGRDDQPLCQGVCSGCWQGMRNR